MTAARKIIIEIIDNTVYLALFYGLLAVPMYLSGHDAGDLRLLLLIAVPFWGNFLLRRFLKNFWAALPAHMIFPAAALFLVPELLPRLIWFIGAAVVALFSLGHYFKRGPGTGAGFIGLCAAVFIILALWAARAGHWPLAALYPALVTLTTIGRVVVLHMLQMDHSLEAIGLSSAQPVRRIISFDYKLAAGLAAVIAALTLLVYFAVTGPAAGFIAGLAPGDLNLRPPPAREAGEAPRPPRDALLPGDTLEFGEMEPSRLAQFIDLFLRIIFSALAAASLVVVIFLILRGIFRWLNRRARYYGYPLDDALTRDEREFVLPVPGKAKRGRHPRQEHRIRRLFRETVARHIKMGVPIKKSDTPTDMAGRIRTEDIGALAEEYADVRYRQSK